MLDPSGRGYISVRQYTQGILNYKMNKYIDKIIFGLLALDTLGIVDYDQKPEGADEDKIKIDTMLKEAYVLTFKLKIIVF